MATLKNSFVNCFDKLRVRREIKGFKRRALFEGVCKTGNFSLHTDLMSLKEV